ncbi:MAG: hypothetical protein U1F26_10945 [Lysobacterales bacterium]
MFKGIGVLLALYVVFAVLSGRVYAKAGMAGEQVHRQTSPAYYWVVIAIYAGLSVALCTVF